MTAGGIETASGDDSVVSVTSILQVCPPSPNMMPLACPEEDVAVMLAGWQTEEEAREG